MQKYIFKPLNVFIIIMIPNAKIGLQCLRNHLLYQIYQLHHLIWNPEPSNVKASKIIEFSEFSFVKHWEEILH